MGDMSGEPSMEHILSSIKRIIAEDGDAATGERRERRFAPRAPLASARAADEDDTILELNEPVADTDRGDAQAEPEMADMTESDPAEPTDAATPPAADLVSPGAVAASKTSLDNLSRLIVRPEITGTDTLEGMVREMLKPMLAEWLETNLPQIVDTQVAREIARITGR